MRSTRDPPADAPCDLRLRDATTAEGRRTTIDIRGGRVAALRNTGAPLPPTGRTLDLGGALVLPGLSDGHVHLDRCRLGVDWRPHRGRDPSARSSRTRTACAGPCAFRSPSTAPRRSSNACSGAAPRACAPMSTSTA